MAFISATGAMVAIAVGQALLGVFAQGRQMHIDTQNDWERDNIEQFKAEILKEIKSKRLDVDKLLTKLQSKNQQALMSYLQTNPIIARTVEKINAATDQIAELQTEKANLEQTINEIQNQLNQVGYARSWHGVSDDDKRRKQLKKELKDASEQYNVIEAKAKTIDASPTDAQLGKAYTADIDARTQNINGGMINNVQEK